MGNPYLVIAAVALLLPALCAGQTEGNSSTKCPDGTMTENEVDCQILTMINTRRSQLATGTQYNGFKGSVTSGVQPTELPSAQNMRKLTWSCDLEQQAKTHVDELVSACEVADDENVEANVLMNDYEYFDADLSTRLWQKLSAIDNQNLTGVGESSVTFAGSADFVNEIPLKAYAILMNSEAKEVGCSQGQCTSGEQPIYYIYCLTDKGDMSPGDKIYDVGKNDKGCNCEAPLTCDSSGLCIEPANTTQAPTVTTSAAVTSGAGSLAPETTTLLSLAEFPGSSSAEPSTWCSFGEISDTMRMHMQDTHNFRRSTLALGQITDNTGATLPAATNMNYLHWNCTLEEQAHNFLRSCPTEGYQRPSDDLPAQNFYRQTITSNEPTWRDMNKKTVTEWWKPVRKVAGPGQSAKFLAQHSGSSIRSYTLMGWAESHQMGCSIARCGSDWVEACLYYPPGNKPGALQYKPGKACSECNTLGQGPCQASLGLCDSEK
ncbi:unnamed protein product [Cylicocyclus nassatus]|uniref:SCP domain-containing protein n=1 Tax=Cylicocyclus nassatus TaxID=53992 RepID=A0AA36H016_CYLNA|nr:unnamed protein product [Cylicocyclus nassatus]